MDVKFSVVIPCYNAERWISETLDSVVNQTFKVHEVIVIDDGSTDSSLDRLQEHSAVTHLLQTQRKGPSVARNAGIQVATGDWIAFLDADDLWYPNHLERITALVKNNKSVVYLAATEHFSINVNRIVSMSDTGPFDQSISGLDHAT